MVTQSRVRPVSLLMTRPKAQGAEFARDLRARFGPELRITDTPLMAPRFFAPNLPEGPFAALILTSQTGVEGYVRLGNARSALPTDVFCVGTRTAKAARDAQLCPLSVADDAGGLINQIITLQPGGKLLHLRGRETRQDINRRLNLAGIDTVEAIIYAQQPRSLSKTAITILRSAEPVVVPLFSPRSAALFHAEMLRVGGTSPLFIAAMSDEVAGQASAIATQIRIAIRPDAAAMLDVVAGLLVALKHA